VRAFAKVNSVDKHIVASPRATLGIVTVGKAHYDFMEVLRRLDLDPNALAAAGVRVYKVGLVFPLEPTRMREFAQGLKRSSSSRRRARRRAPDQGAAVRPARLAAPAHRRQDGRRRRAAAVGAGRAAPSRIMPRCADWLARLNPALDRRDRVVDFLMPALLHNAADAVRRQPYFCSGCPHNTRPSCPRLARAGRHRLPLHGQLDGARHLGLIQMGAEGVDWARTRASRRRSTSSRTWATAPTSTRAAGHPPGHRGQANITYKMLYNDAVAMTGGQPVDGTISVPEIARQVEAEAPSAS
jgi:indolepyruvate ferredoxin oxidoreductase